MNADLLVLGAAWLSALMGSAHCAAMCGGIAAGFSVPGQRTSWLDALEPNLGRVLGYGLAGLVAGAVGHGITGLLPLERIAVMLRAAVGLVLIAAALRLLDSQGRLRLLDLPGQTVWRWLAPLQHRLRPGAGGTRRLLAGIVWGWLPCGLSTTLLAAAALQGSALHGAATMLAFGLGTLPAMVPLTWSGARLGQSLGSRGLRRLAGSVVLVAGLLTMAAPWLGHLPGMHGMLAALGCRSLG